LLTWHVPRREEASGTHVGILSINASNKISETVFLFIFVWDKDGIGVERALMDLEACFVCNPVAISEGRRGRSVISGHIMDDSKQKKDYGGRKII
jgi:hypothetical protein